MSQSEYGLCLLRASCLLCAESGCGRFSGTDGHRLRCLLMRLRECPSDANRDSHGYANPYPDSNFDLHPNGDTDLVKGV